MPPYIYNDLYVSGPDEVIQKFYKTVCCDNTAPYCSHKILLNSTVPEPEKKEEPDIPWGTWRIQNWGTKTDEANCEFIERGDGYLFKFDTAWTPPNQWIKNTAKLFPELTFKNAHIKEGLEAGVCTVWSEDGKLIDEYVTMNEHEWRMEYDDLYREEYIKITQGDYQKVIEFYAECDPEYDVLEVEIIKRAKDEDLPLFVNKEWETGEAQDLYEERLRSE